MGRVSWANQELWRRNDSRCLIGVGALFVTRIDCSCYVVISLPVGDGGIGVDGAGVQHWIDFRIGPAGLDAAINVIPADVLRCARGPGEINGVLRGRGADARKGFHGRRVRSIAGERDTAGG